MGDFVEETLDRTLPELRFIIRHKLLTKAQVHQLVRTRRNFEYRLLSKRVTRADYLRYASFESSHADRLRQRCNALKLKPRTTARFLARAKTRTNMILSRATFKFRGDVDLWLHYARYCIKENSRKAAAKVFARALALHPTSEKLWLATISFHYDTLDDPASARRLSQSSLRYLPQSKTLFEEYFRLELTYLCRLRFDRQSVAVAIPDNSFWNGGVPQTVFDAARRAVNLTVVEMAEYLELCNSTPFSPEQLSSAIYGSLVDAYPDHAVTRIAALRIPLDRALAEKRRLSAANDGENEEEKKAIEQAERAAKEAVETVTDKLLLTVTREKDEIPSAAIQNAAFINLVNLLVQLLSDASKKEQLLSLVSPKRRVENENVQSLEDATRVNSAKGWRNFLRSREASRPELVERIRSELSRCCAVPLRTKEQDEVASLWVTWEGSRGDVDELRACYRKLLRLSQSAGVALAAADAEASLKGPSFADHARRMFAIAERERGSSDESFWVKWWKFENDEMHDGSEAGKVYWKAVARLKKAKRFVELVQVDKLVN